MRQFILTFTLLAFALVGCASTPEGRAIQFGEIQKVTVDSLGNTFLDVCEEIVTPACKEENASMTAAGTPWSKEDRVACLGPCASEPSSKIKTALDAVIAAQVALFGLLKGGESDEGRLKSARDELREAGERLLRVLEETGARDLVERKLLGAK